MIAKIVKIALLVIVLGSIVYGVYKSPQSVLDPKVQEQLINTADKLDKEIDSINTQSGVTYTGSLK